MASAKYPNWNHTYKDFLNQYRPPIIIDRTEPVYIEHTTSETSAENDEGEWVDTIRHTKLYYFVSPEEEFNGKTLYELHDEDQDWRDGVVQYSKFKVLESWFIMNSDNLFINSADKFSIYNDNFSPTISKSWYDFEDEPEFDADFRFVLVSDLGAVPSAIAKFSVLPNTPVGANGYAKLNGASTSSSPSKIDNSGDVMLLATDSFYEFNVYTEYGIVNNLDMPEIQENDYDVSMMVHLTRPMIISGVGATFPGYKYFDDTPPYVSFSSGHEIWPGINYLPTVDFLNQLGNKITTTITNEQELQDIRFGDGMTFELANDLDLSSLPNINNYWGSLISADNDYSSDFIKVNIRGNGHIITAEDSPGGLFNRFRGGVIRDITFKDIFVGKPDVGKGWVGLIIDEADYTVSEDVVNSSSIKFDNIEVINCHVECNAQHDPNLSYKTAFSAGGLIGTINTTSWGTL